ncbi:hypothetical protein HZS_7280 [Henneguya salminicola]|nr:hypothetical protein HZS_7280 [Henneguya salminicola]
MMKKEIKHLSALVKIEAKKTLQDFIRQDRVQLITPHLRMRAEFADASAKKSSTVSNRVFISNSTNSKAASEEKSVTKIHSSLLQSNQNSPSAKAEKNFVTENVIQFKCTKTFSDIVAHKNSHAFCYYFWCEPQRRASSWTYIRLLIDNSTEDESIFIYYPYNSPKSTETIIIRELKNIDLMKEMRGKDCFYMIKLIDHHDFSRIFSFSTQSICEIWYLKIMQFI